MENSFRKLVVWQKSMELVAETYRLVKKLPSEELYALSSQMRRAAISIPSNIAEGQARNSNKKIYPVFVYCKRVKRGTPDAVPDLR